MNNFSFRLLIFIMVLFVTNTNAQSMKNWFNQDPETDRYAGVSSDKSYESLLKNKPSKEVIVAIIDGGTDVNHPDLEGNLWVNANEIAGNSIDDDGNGYIDDIHGWNFIGGPDGNVDADNLEIIRIYRDLLRQFAGIDASNLPKSNKASYQRMLDIKTKIDDELREAQINLDIYQRLKNHMDRIQQEMGNNDFTAESLLKKDTTDEEYLQVKMGVAAAIATGVTFKEVNDDINEAFQHFYNLVHYNYNINFDPRDIVGDNYSDYNERYYGNNDVTGPDPLHGTHVAGIVGAIRNNTGASGVATNVKLMIIRAVPNGDERDKDVANAIRYAVDNGALIINMSFGKDYSPGKIHVDDAIRYAVQKDVLMVHAAGNDASNNDKIINYPAPFYSNSSERIPGWIEVGAITSSGDLADFSNYGRKTVDVLAPGVNIYSTMPDSVYDFQNGTSMAAPVVTGVAAIIRSYYPELSAEEVKQAITSSVIKPNIKTALPGSKKKVRYKKLCTSGGIVNVYLAILHIEED